MKVFHKASTAGMIGLLLDPSEAAVCASTEACVYLFPREYCLVYEIPEDKLLVRSEQDIDAHDVTPWDEVRFNIEDAELIEIIGSRRFKWNEADERGFADVSVSYDVYEFNGDHDLAKRAVARDCFKSLEIVPTGKSKYNRGFLNIK